jgi:hypothetical protein
VRSVSVRIVNGKVWLNGRRVRHHAARRSWLAVLRRWWRRDAVRPPCRSCRELVKALAVATEGQTADDWEITIRVRRAP